MDENEHFNCDNMQILAIDEADRILDMGFRQQVIVNFTFKCQLISILAFLDRRRH
jgi:hypothetical protein